MLQGPQCGPNGFGRSFRERLAIRSQHRGHIVGGGQSATLIKTRPRRVFSVHERWLPSRLPELRLKGLDARVALLDLGTRLLDLHARQVMQAAISGNQW